MFEISKPMKIGLILAATLIFPPFGGLVAWLVIEAVSGGFMKKK